MKTYYCLAVIVVIVTRASCHAADADALPPDQLRTLLADLKSVDPQKRLLAAERLGEAKSHADAVIPRLKEMMLAEAEDQWASRAAVSIASYGKRGETELLELATVKDPRIRSLAISALEFTRVSDGDTVRKVIRQLRDPDPRVRLEVLNLVAVVGYSAAVRDVIDLAKNDPDEGVRLQAIASSSSLDGVANHIVPVLLDVLRAGDGRWTGWHRSRYREVTASALGYLGGDAMPFVLSALKDAKDNNQFKIDLMAAIGRNHSQRKFPEAVPLLAESLSDNDGRVRTKALTVLSSYDAKVLNPHRETIAKIIQSPGSTEELESALYAITRVDPHDRALHEGLTKFLGSKTGADRARAVRLTSRMPTPVVKEYLGVFSALLDDTDEAVRFAAIEGLRHHLSGKDSEVLKKLRRMAEQDAGQSVRDKARQTYQEITRTVPKPKG